MDIRKIKYFLSVAQTLSFTKAAKQHFISQTAMSQQIASMEEELGFLLFNRTKNMVELTAAGRSFMEDVKGIVEAYERAVRKAKAINDNVSCSILVGFTDETEREYLSLVIEEYKRLNPDAHNHIDVIKTTLTNIKDDMVNNLYDAIIAPAPLFDDLKDIDRIRLCSAEVLLGVSHSHPKAKRHSIEASEIAEEKIIMFVRSYCPELYDSIRESCKKDGYEPNFVGNDRLFSVDAILLLVEMDRGVAFFPDTPYTPKCSRIAYLKVENSSYRYNIDLAWKPQMNNPVLNKFIQAAYNVQQDQKRIR